ncbi:MAG: hypothetical protein AAGK22_08565 [Acidobacteriota bacterium]
MRRNRTTLLYCTTVVALLLSLGSPVVAEEGRKGDPDLSTATFSMYCYWTGEATLGRVDGVHASRIGHWDGREIVQVDYDPTRTSVDELAQALATNRSLYAVVRAQGENQQATSAEQRTLRGRPKFIPPKHSLRTVFPRIAALQLTEEQAIALNSWAYFGGSMPDVLTAEQKLVLASQR